MTEVIHGCGLHRLDASSCPDVNRTEEFFFLWNILPSVLSDNTQQSVTEHFRTETETPSGAAVAFL